MRFALSELPTELRGPVFDWVDLPLRHELLRAAAYSRRHVLRSPFPKALRCLRIEARWAYFHDDETHQIPRIVVDELELKVSFDTDTVTYEATGLRWSYVAWMIRTCECVTLIDSTLASPQSRRWPEERECYLSVAGYFSRLQIKHLRRLELDCHVANLLPDLFPFEVETVQEISVSLKRAELDEAQYKHLRTFLQDPAVSECRERLSIHANLPLLGSLTRALVNSELPAPDFCHTVRGGWRELGATFHGMILSQMAPTLYPTTTITLSMLSGQPPILWPLVCMEFERFAGHLLQSIHLYRLEEADAHSDDLLALVECAFCRYEEHHRIKIFQAQSDPDQLYVMEMLCPQLKDQPIRVDIRFESLQKGLCPLLNRRLKELGPIRKDQNQRNVEFRWITEPRTNKQRLFLQATS